MKAKRTVASGMWQVARKNGGERQSILGQAANDDQGAHV